MITGRLGHARVVVLSVIEAEMDAVLSEFGANFEVGTSGAFAPQPSIPGAVGAKPIFPYVVARCEDRSNGAAQSTARDMLEFWRPEYVILCGVAGGILRPNDGEDRLEGPNLGDVVVAEYVHYADYGSRLGSAFSPRFIPVVHPPSNLVRRHTDGLKHPPIEWPARISEIRPRGGEYSDPHLLTGEIIAVEAIAGAPLDAHQMWYLKNFSKAIAVDMESYGVARALHDYEGGVHYHPRWLAVRGVSDHVVGGEVAQRLLANDNYAMRQEWKPYAAATAAHVARRLVERLLVRERPEHPVQPGAPSWPTRGVSVADGRVSS